MTQRQLAFVGLKLLGIYTVLNLSFSIDMLITAILAPFTDMHEVPTFPAIGLGIVSVATIVCVGIVALLLIFRSEAITRRLFKPGPVEEQALPAGQLTQRQLAVVCFKLLGIYAITLAIWNGESLMMNLVSLSGRDSPELARVLLISNVGGGVRVAVTALAAFFLVFRSEGLARWLLREPAGPAEVAPPGLQGIQAIAFSVAGVIILLYAVPRFGYAVLRVSDLFAAGFLHAVWRSEFWQLFGDLLRFALGVYLLLGARCLARLLHKAYAVATNTGKATPDQPAGPETKER